MISSVIISITLNYRVLKVIKELRVHGVVGVHLDREDYVVYPEIKGHQ